MNKAELIEAITERMGDKKTASHAVEVVVDAITRSVAKGEKVAITGFGVFEKVDRAARTARNPATGAAVKLKKTSVPKFRAGQGFKDVVSGAKKVTPIKKTVAKAVRAAATTGRAGTPPAPTKAAGRATAAKSTRSTSSTAPAKSTRSTSGTAPAKSTTTRGTAASKSAAAKTLASAPSKSAASSAGRTPASPAKKASATKATAPAKRSPAKKAAR